MEIMKRILFLAVILIPQKAWACPACLLSDNNRFTFERLILLGVMGVLPLMLALFVGYKIYRMGQKRSAS